MLARCNMAISAKKGKDRVIKKVLHYFLFVNIVSQLVPCRGSIELQSKAFMNVLEEELYNSGIPFQESLRYESPSFNSDIFFNPPFMDFGSRPIGMPFVQQIMVHNTNPQLSLHLLSISGSSPHFHCSFFEDKLLAPLGNTSFEVCFLAQNLGQIKTTLYIHSSRGSFKYYVSGEGTQNPYRIRPVLGARVPINSSFSPIIHLYNPHESVLQVQEIYSSGSDLHLELPSGQVEATKDLWVCCKFLIPGESDVVLEIPPYETKPIMKANFLGRVENNHTAFIRIKTNKENKEELLVVPMEVEVTSNPGLFSVVEMLDFGILRTFDESISHKVKVINSKLQAIQIRNVTIEPPNEAVDVDFVPLEIEQDIFNPTAVALVTFHATKVSSQNDCSGHIVLWTSDPTQKLQIPYNAQVYFGDLKYSKSLYFYSGDSVQIIPNNFSIKNLFQHPIVIFNISLGPLSNGIFSILNFSKPIHIEPGEEMVLMTILFHPDRADLHFNSEIFLHTNLSIFSTSLIVFNGKLQVYYESNFLSGHLNFGTLAIGEKRSLNFTLLNDNPSDIVISRIHTSFKSATIHFFYLNANNDMESNRMMQSCSIQNPCVIRSHQKAVLSLTVQAPDIEGTYSSEVIIETENQLLVVEFILQTTIGNIMIDSSKLLFRQCFPGRVVEIDLHVNSSFQKDLKLQDVSFLPNDYRFKFIPQDNHLTIISPNKESLVGSLLFDPIQECLWDCYSALSTDTSAGYSWLLGLSLNKSVVEIDILLYSRFKHKWNSMSPSEKILNITMQLNTDHIKGFLFNLQAVLSWPLLLNQSSISFPLTQIGNQSTAWFTIENPSSLSLLIHIVPIFLYPDVYQFLTSLGPHLTKEENLWRENGVFDIKEGNISFNAFTISATLDADSMKELSLEHVAGVRPLPNTSVILIRPGKMIYVKLTFQPLEEESYSSLFIIRNNLTIVELVKVQGQGGLGDLRLSNRRPGSTKPLTFEMSDKHFKLCEKSSTSKIVQPNLSIKRSFTLHNLGHLPITINSFEISGRKCEGYGFRILDCAPLTLHANESKKLNIIFTPDFTMSKVRHSLVMHTCLSVKTEFILQANIPSFMISKCASVLPRPLWEPMMFYCIVVLMGFMAVCIVTAAYYESNQILSNELNQMRNEHIEGYYDKSKVFDLRLCSNIETQKYLNKKVVSHESFNSPSSDGKSPQSNTCTTSSNKLSAGQKTSKSAIGLASLLSDICQGLKMAFASNHNNHKKPCNESKKKNENGRFILSLPHIFKSKNVEKVQNTKKDLSPVQGRNDCLLQRKTENDTMLTLRKNKRQKNFMTNKSLDLLIEPEVKASLRNKSDVASRLCRQDARKVLLSEMKLPDKNDDSSSTATDTSSLENDEKTILTEYQSIKKEKNKIARAANGSTKNINVTQDEQIDGTLHSPKRKLGKDVEENSKISRPKHENSKLKSSALRGKRKSNTSGVTSEIKLRPHSKSPTPIWDSASLDGDDLSDIVNQTNNFAKMKSASLCTEKHSKCNHSNPNKSPESHSSSSIASPNKLIKSSSPATIKATIPVSSLSTIGGRPVAAVGATIRRPWVQLAPSSVQNVIANPSKGLSTNAVQGLHSPDPFLTSTHLLNSNSASRSGYLASSDSKNLIHNSCLEPINNLKPPMEKHDAMMQKLLAERRKRVLEYQKKMLISEWKHSSIGKNAAASQQQWNECSGYWPSQSCMSSGVGSMPLAPRYDIFRTSAWSNNNFTSRENTWLSPSSIWRFNEPLKLDAQDNDTHAIFDPFNTLENNGSIWNPTSTGSSMNNGWDMSCSTKPSSDDK